MAYATHDNVIAAFRARGMVELVEESGSSMTSTGEDRIDAECDEQSSFIDGFLLGRATTPVTEPAELLAVLKVHCMRLVMWGLFQDRLMSYPWVQTDHDDTMSWLKRVADGQISLLTAPQAVDSPSAGEVQCDTPVFVATDGLL